MTLLFDALVAVLVLAAAAHVVLSPGTRPKVIAFIVLGVLLALAWVRLDAVDVALTEAAVGGGATGFMLLRAVGRLTPTDAPRPGRPVRIAAAVLCAAVAAGLAAVVFTLPAEAPSLAAPAAASLGAFGLANPVTGVLLGYRALDTLLEKVVMLLAVVAVWALAQDDAWSGRPAPLADGADDGTLGLVARTLPPVGIVFAVHLVWTGADHPGGTFQAGAVLAAMWLLAMMAGVVRMPRTDGRRLRLALFAGPALFIAVGFAGVAAAGAFLAYPPGIAKPVIVAVELALTVTIAAVVALLVAGPAVEERR
jgi:multisubunit Na+/H+ antiporter MnhB subunit